MSQRDVQWGTLLESNITPHPALAELLNPQQRAQAVTSLTARDSQRAEAWRYTRLKGFNDRSLYNVSALAQATPSYTDVSGLSVYRISDLATRSAHLTGLTAEACVMGESATHLSRATPASPYPPCLGWLGGCRRR